MYCFAVFYLSYAEQENMKKRHQQKLVILAVVLFFLWNVPFVSIFNGFGHILGFPSVYIFIFCSWFIAIVISYIVLKRFYG
ncbi:Hypothetical protein I595_747 [Croceitalea dokdonensis DOKDO 023]|uniref:Uncharacterized protein n=1 Tax=Croceitalea dokdonensis DOKDO 023 TaxID=1300341 RepID=A0A0P7B2U8_9FLAO|nr:Hypothetical protein I595_747 [Croceitalea dokdonensis DOKDO 023]